MYYPYFRGRQNELICLRELLEENRLDKNIIPVLEPVRFSSTFFSTVRKFIEADRKLIIIKNPCVGSFLKEIHEMEKKIEESKSEDKKDKLEKKLMSYKKILKDESLQFAYLVNKKTVMCILDKKINLNNVYLISKERGDYSYFREYGKELEAKATFIPNNQDFKDEVLGNTIVLEDCYHKARRNIDYLNITDEFFSKNHLVYLKRGYMGFSDYSIVGEEFEESGFAPLAIAIHIMYFDERDELRVHHFVSNSNENISDPARKFEEAMKKLIEWERLDTITITKGLDSLLTCYKIGKFPGLGGIKKYSLMHHMELMSIYLGDK